MHRDAYGCHNPEDQGQGVWIAGIYAHIVVLGLYLSPLLAFNFLSVDSSSGRLILCGVHLATSSYHLCEKRAPFPPSAPGKYQN